MTAKPENNILAIRPATPDDVPTIYSFILELAEYERLRHIVTATETDIREALFSRPPVAEALLAFHEGQPVGFALFFRSFSTFVGRPGLYLEDIYVKPEMRGKGIGRALLVRLAKIAQERRCGRMEWSVLDWNRPAIDFYKNLGAESLNEWTVFRLSGDNLNALADETAP